MGNGKTYSKEAKNFICSVKLNDLRSKNKKLDFISDESIIPKEIYYDLVLLTPTEQSHLGTKFSNKISKHLDKLVNDLIKELDIKNVYFFDSFTSQKQKTDLTNKVKNNNNTFIALRCSDGLSNALYSSIRNALAHGNILKDDKYYYLYSLSLKGNTDIPEKERKLVFLLKIRDIKKLTAYTNVFKKYN